MSVVIYGERPYGRVHTYDGEYADTLFMHVDFIPLFPVKSFWITHNLGGGERLGFPIKLHLKSVLATYLRIWGPVFAAIAFMSSTSLVTTVISTVLTALIVWSWIWRSRRGKIAMRRSDFDRVALGSRCDPAWMTDQMRKRISRDLASRLAQREDPRSPDDVARFGAKDLDEAVLAYGLLRLDAAQHLTASAAADRLLTSAFDELPFEGGPYRERLAGSVPELGAAISAAARAQAEAERARIRATRVKPRWFQRPWLSRWFRSPRLQLIGLLFLTPPLLVIGIAIIAFAVPHTIGAKELAFTYQSDGQVTIRCDRVPAGGWEVRERGVLQRVSFCWLGTRVLPVISAADHPVSARTVEGYLSRLPINDRPDSWVQALHRHVELDARSYDVYLDRDSVQQRVDIVFGAALCLPIVAGWVFWIRAFLRRRRSATA